MTRVLVVAMADSVHTGRWLSQFDGEAIEFVLFPSTPHRRIHPLIKQRLGTSSETLIKISRWMKFAALPLGVADLVFGNFFRGKLLSQEIKKFQPDVIHIMETQHAGYLTDKALSSTQTRPTVILSIWGSDLFWYRRFAKHHQRLSSLLPKVDYLITECRRDEGFAREFGFVNKCIYGIPASGGVLSESFKDSNYWLVPSLRKTIAIKGYSGFVGLGPFAIKALAPLVEELNTFEVVIYSCSYRTQRLARKFHKQTGLNIKIFVKHSLTTKQMEELFLRSRVVVGVSLSDGLPATIKEAISTGAFPVQTDTSCAEEWLEDGVSALLIPPDDSVHLSNAILRALTDNQLVDNAAQLNLQIAKTRMDSVLIRKQILEIYG